MCDTSLIFYICYVVCSVWCVCFCFFNHTATTEIYTYLHTLSLHDALPICASASAAWLVCPATTCRCRRAAARPWKKSSPTCTRTAATWPTPASGQIGRAHV